MKLLITSATLLALATTPTLAHHSGAMFDRSVTLEMEATIVEYKYESPHVWIFFDVAKENGEIEQWAAEGNAPYNMRARGVVPSVVTPGLKVTMRIHPLRTGQPAGSFIDMTLEDGTVLSGTRPR